MKIAITGSKGIAHALKMTFSQHDVCLLSRSTGYDINVVHAWGSNFLDRDMFVNCAYDGWAQVHVLQFFYDAWHQDTTKTIVTLGSRAIYYPDADPNAPYWPYRTHKQALQSAHDAMQSRAQCRMLIINPGPTDTDMVRHRTVAKLSSESVAQKILVALDDPTIRRLDLWL